MSPPPAHWSLVPEGEQPTHCGSCGAPIANVAFSDVRYITGPFAGSLARLCLTCYPLSMPPKASR